MHGKRILFLSLFVAAIVAIAGIPTKSQYYEIKANGDPNLIAGRNVNMVSGMTFPDGDPYLQRQNEPSIAVSTRNPLHLLAGANDYRTVDIPGGPADILPGQMQNQSAGDAWLGVFKSFDGGESWISTLLDGYPQQQNSSSPLNGYQAAADPVVRAGTNGLFFYSGIVFNRDEPKNSAVFVARFIDNNNVEEGDPIQQIDTTIIDALDGGRFKDKPWIAVDVPKNNAKKINIAGQSIPRSNVYIVYSVFKEVNGTQQSEIHFCRSTNCGNTWEKPIIISSGHLLNQGATIAVDPRGNGHVYVAWRRFGFDDGQTTQSNAIVIARSTNGGRAFPDIIEVTDVPGPFDQPTSSVGNPLPGTAFRTNSYPTMTIDDRGRIYIAWAQRGIDPIYPFDSRLLIATSKDGFVWTTPMAVESSILAADDIDCHEFMPSVAFAGGRLILAWYDTRNDYCPETSPEWICDYDLPGTIRHTIDVRVAQGQPGEFPIFQPSVQVSRYLWGMWESSPGNYYFSQVQFNPPNYPLFKGGTVPFHGDYIEIAPSPSMVQDGNGKWRFNTEPTDSQLFHLAWTDNRDVRPPENNNWTIYNPPSVTQSLSQSEFYVSTPCVDVQSTGMRNQNIYTSLITSVVEAGSPGNNKPLGTLGTNPATGEMIPRAFVIFVKNPTEDIRNYRLQITDQPDHGTASFLEFDMLEEIDVSIAPFSSISRPLFVTSSDENDTVTIEVFEINKPGGSPVVGGAHSTVVINQDDTAPEVSGDLQDTETHDPDIESPNIVNWTYVNPNIVNPNIVNPNIVNPNIVNPNIVNPNIVNPNIVNPNIVNPNIVNPNIVNPNIVNPNIVNPNIINSSIEDADVTDIEWNVTNAGNTVSSYTFKIFARESLPRGIYAQLLVYKVHYTPATDGSDCQLQQTPHHELLLNIVNPNIVNPNIVNPNIVNPNIVNAAIENATFFLSPGDEAMAVLRLIDPEPAVTKFLQSGKKFKIQQFAESLGAAAGSQAVDSDDAAQGDTTAEADSTELIITTSGLPDGTVGEAYLTPELQIVRLEAVGGDGAFFWSVNSELLPPGLGFTNDGVISGIPQDDPNVAYPHIYSFIVQVTSGGEFDTQNLSITINSAEEPTPPLDIETTILPSGTVGNYYGFTLQATGGIPPRLWSADQGALPTGLSLDSAGVISGTIENDPEVIEYPHVYEFNVQVTDANEDTDTQLLSITVSDIVYPDLTISGTITDGYGSAVQGVSIYGLPHAPQTDSYGFYSDTVPHGWSGTTTPFKAGYTFQVSAIDPSSSRTYTEITTDQYDQDFVAATINYTIAGTVTSEGSPLEGVTMNGLPGTPTTNAEGYYSAPVPHEWTGTVTPELSGYTFDPPSRTYTTVTSDYVGQDYTATYVWGGQDDSYEQNDTFGNASEITPGTLKHLELFDDDWYKVNVEDGQDLKVMIEGINSNNIDVEIYDSSETRMVGAYGSPQDETVYASDLSTGLYYIYVIYLGTTDYWNSYSITVETGDAFGSGGITGKITNISTDGIDNIDIWAYDTQSDHHFLTTTDAFGDYKISLLPSFYKLWFDASNVEPENYISEYYDNQNTLEDADVLDVQLDMTITGVDAVLDVETGLTIITTSLPDGYIATQYSAQIEATGGTEPYTWALAPGSDSLPPGLEGEENNTTATIEGIPTVAGTYNLIVQVTDSSPTPQIATQPLSITIHPFAGTGYSISGTVTDNGTPISGVEMVGLPGTPLTNEQGEYSMFVYPGWSGTVMPILSGYAFTPASTTYNNVNMNQENQDYTASVGYTISGEIRLEGAPLSGVMMSGLPGDPVSDENGQYSGSVPDDWTGTVTPTLPGFTFTPVDRTYSNVSSNQTGQDYTVNFAGGQDDTYEPNDDYANAAEVTLGSHTNLVLSDVDWFKVNISADDAGKDLRINMKAQSFPEPGGWEDLDFIVVDESEKMLGSVSSSSDDENLYITDISEGWYYIGHVYISQPGTVYTLTVEVSDGFGIGYISGRVTNQQNGQGIEGAYVELYGDPFDWANSRPLVTTDENGYYTVGYTPGNYTVRFNLHNFYHRQEFAADVNYIGRTYNYNEIVPIVAGTTVTDIDTALTPGGAITGRVTDLDGNAPEWGYVYVYRSDNVRISLAYTDGNGYYSAERMASGNYKVRFFGSYEGMEWYDETGSFDDGDPVPVLEGATTPNIDGQLGETAYIEGRVTDGNGAPIQDVIVRAYDVSGISLNAAGWTDANGEYRIQSRLPTSEVKIWFDARSASGNYASMYYPDVFLIEDADPVAVQAGETTYGIDAELAEGGTVTGRVTNAQGDELSGINVVCFSVDSDRSYGTTTDHYGNYTIAYLLPGDYRVLIHPTSGNYAVEWYNDKNSFATGDIINVGAGAMISDIDAQLVDNGGFISGRVTDINGNGIESVRVIAQDSTKELGIASTDTDYDGYYTIPRMPTCSAKIFFNADRHYLNYVSEYYNDQSTHGSAESIAVTSGQETPGINAVLANIPPLAITNTSLPNGEVAEPYSETLDVTGGRGFHSWSIISGTLPDGLTLNSKGEISGIPTSTGMYNFTVRATDSCWFQLVDTQNLSITIDTYQGTGVLISGAVSFEGSPLPGVLLQGLPGNPVTSVNGEYIIAVSPGWSGTVTPILQGYAFTPVDRSYDDVTANQIDQDYTASVGLAISGTVWLDGQGLPGVIMSGLPGDPTTDANGYYMTSIPSGWSGTGIPSKEGHSFDPPSRNYVSVASDQIDQDYDATSLLTLEWVASYDGPAANSWDDALAVATDSSGNVYVTGTSDGIDSLSDIVTIKYNSAGTKLWEARHNSPENGSDYGNAIAVDYAGNVYVTGYGGYDQSQYYLTLKYDSNGNQVWIAKYDGPGNQVDRANAIAVDSAGNVFVTGYSYDTSGGSQDYATVKYDSNGIQAWAAIYDGPANGTDRAADIAVDASGNVYVTGYSQGIGTSYDFATIKYDSEGNQDWVVTYDNDGGSDQASAMILDPEANVYVTGHSVNYSSGTGYDYATIKYDSDGNQVWIALYDNSNSDRPQDIAFDPAGNVYVTGEVRETYPNYDYGTVKYNSAGVEQWAAIYDGPGNDSDRVTAITTDSSGDVYVTGGSIGSGAFNEYATIKYDSASGNELWVRRYDGSANGDDGAAAIVVDSSGNIVITGRSHGSSTNYDYATIKYDSDGNQQWLTRYDSPANHEEMNWFYGDIMALDSSNNVYVSGYTYGNGTGYDYTTVKFDSSGGQIWAKQYNGPGNYTDYAYSMTVDSSGNVYVTGITYIDGADRDYATIKYDSAGNQQWAVTYDGPANGYDWAYAIAVDTLGNVYVTGESEGIGTFGDCTTIKYDSTGNQQWVARYNGLGGDYDGGMAITADTLGNIYVTGYSFTGTNYDFLTIKYDNEGNQLWDRTYNGPENQYDEANHIALDSSNNVYVCGRGSGSNSNDYFTVKYDSVGNFQWASQYDGSGHGYDYPLCLKVDSADNVYVTGMSGGTDMSRDFATIKYDGASGDELWVRRYSGESTGSYDYGNDLAFDSSGNVYVTGRSGGSGTYYDAASATIKYDSAGNLLWIARYKGPGDSFIGTHSISVNAIGEVYVGGMGFGIGTGIDFIVLKYRQ